MRNLFIALLFFSVALYSSAQEATGIQTTILALNKPDPNRLEVSISPNGSANLLLLEINNSKIPSVIVSVKDSGNSEILREEHTGAHFEMRINSESWGKAAYLVTLLDEAENIISRYKVFRQ